MAQGELTADEVRLWSMVEQRCQPGADTAAIDQRLWDTFGHECAILYTDLSGFSRRVAEFGIIHFLQVILEQKRLLLPLSAAHDGTLISTEGDSLLVIFPKVEAAVRATLAMQRACAAYNTERPPEEHLLLCAGIGYGRVLRIGDANVWGAEVNAASKLGEDTAGSFEILVTGEAKVALLGTAVVEEENLIFSDLDFAPPGSSAAHRLEYSL
jgi:class 3 adenylate cyclase